MWPQAREALSGCDHQADALNCPRGRGMTLTQRTRLHREDISMRAQFLAFTFLAAIAASAASAQSPMTQFMSDKDIMALIEKAKAERKGDAAMVPLPILQLAPYKA